MFVRLTDITEHFVLNLKVCYPALSWFLYRKPFCDLLYNAEHKNDHVCHLEYTWNTAQASADSLAYCFPSLRTEFLIRYAEIGVFMKRKTFCNYVDVSTFIGITQPYPISHRINPKILSLFSPSAAFSVAHKHQKVFRTQFPRAWSIQIGLTREGTTEMAPSVKTSRPVSLSVVPSPPPHL